MAANTALPKKHWAERNSIWLRHNWPVPVSILGGILYGLSGAAAAFLSKPDEANALAIWAFWLGTALVATGGMGGLVLAPRVVALEEKAEKAVSDAVDSTLALHNVMSGLLAEVLRGLKRYRVTCRASVYVFADDSFYILGRSSFNPALRVAGRREYPKAQGVIGTAWETGFAVVRDLPDDRDAWNKRMLLDFGISEEVAQGLKMQCRSIVAIRIDQVGPGGSRPAGIAVFESTLPREIASSTLDEVMKLPEWLMVQAAIAGGKESLPQVMKSAAHRRKIQEREELKREQKAKKRAKRRRRQPDLVAAPA